MSHTDDSFALSRYLSERVKDRSITDITRKRGEFVAGVLSPFIGSPDAAIGPEDEDNSLCYYWNSHDKEREHHLSIEITPSGVLEFFYRNRKTEEIYGEDFNDIGYLIQDKETFRYLKILMEDYQKRLTEAKPPDTI
jgi:hypothetical protein